MARLALYLFQYRITAGLNLVTEPLVFPDPMVGEAGQPSKSQGI
jgi:hypothetical protein